jgi:hypothetical protein
MVVDRHEQTSRWALQVISEYPVSQKLFKLAGLHHFFAKCWGYNDEMMLQFSCGFDGKVARIGNLEMEVSKETLAYATRLPRMGERWFENLHMNVATYNKFLKSKFHYVDCEKGVSRTWIKDEWVASLEFIHRFLTCEGRYARTYQYHIRLLFHFEFGNQINFPYYLWISLINMSGLARSNNKNHYKILYHHGLVKILIIAELGKRNESWGNFIAQNKFGRLSNEMVIGDQEEQSTANITNNCNEYLGSSGAGEFIFIEGNPQKSKTT